MTGTAIIMMIIAMLVVWGGLVVAVVFLARNPLAEDRGRHTDEMRDDPETRHHL